MKIDWAELEDFCRYTKNPPLSDLTIKHRGLIFKRVWPFFEKQGWSEKTIQEYLQLKRKEGIKNKSVNEYLKVFRMIDEYLSTSCASNLRKLPEEDTYFDVFTFEEIQKIISYNRSLSAKARVRIDQNIYKVLFSLLSEMALRIEEALSLKWEDWKGDYFTIYGKTKKYDDLLVSPALQHKLNTMKREGEYLFPLSRQAVNRELKKRAKDLGINKVVSSHIFRRSFATVAIEQGIQRDFVQQRMRHRNSSSLDKYIRKSKRHQREVLQRHPFTVDSMSQEDKVSYIRGKQRELEDEMRRLGVTREMLAYS